MSRSRDIANIGDDVASGTVLTSSGAIDVNASAPADSLVIDASGNVLVGKTSSGIGTAGIELRANDDVLITKDGDACLYMNRLTSAGTIVDLRKDGTNYGIINIDQYSQLLIGQGNTCVIWGSGNQRFSPSNADGSGNDGNMVLGWSNRRWDVVYATTGSINTSDRNEKQDVEELSEAEQRVAVAAKALMRKFRWKDAVAEKGDDARVHFGIIAQDLQAAFEAEGLDAGRYAMFCSDTWWESEETYTDDDGVEQTRTNTYDTADEAPEGAIERTRLGVRYSELLAFIIAAL